MSNSIVVQFAAYGALGSGNENKLNANNVTNTLQNLLNTGSPSVTINNATMGGDPSPGDTKNFGALVAVNGTPYAFGCMEGQTINFAAQNSSFTVSFAVYGALGGGNENKLNATNVTSALQTLLNTGPTVTINNTTMGGDPSPGDTKNFGALVTVNGVQRAFSCQEGQTVDFSTFAP